MNMVKIFVSLALVALLSACGSDSPSSSSTSSSSSSAGSTSSNNSSSSSSSSTSSGGTQENVLVIEEAGLGYCGNASFTEAEHTGFSGAGYTNTINEVGAEIVWSVTADTNMVASLDIRFAYYGSTSRQAQVSINNGGSQVVSFQSTGAWTTWLNTAVNIDLNAGENTIRLVSDSAEGLPNIDNVSLNTLGVKASACSDAQIPDLENPGFIRVTDPVVGWASEAGGTAGGGTNIGNAITVSSMSELKNAVANANEKLILVNPGNYKGELAPGANTTIIGKAPGVTITGSIKISGSDKHNIVIRNLAVRGEKCDSYEACKAGADAVYIGNDAHHVWLDHLDIADGQDGNCDITKGGDFVTVSWTKFHYTYDKEHRFSNLIAGSDDEPQSVGKLRITYMNSWWGDRVDARQPRGRFGKIHMLNNYHNTGGSQIHGVGKQMSLIAEASHYDESGRSIFKDMGDPQGWKGMANIGSAQDLNASRGSVFTIPYRYNAMPASEVKEAITSANCGAGNTCQLQL